MEFANYLKPFEKKNLGIDKKISQNQESFYNVAQYTGEKQNLQDYDIALLGVEEERNSHNKGTKNAPDEIRKELYKLINHTKLKIIDLGNMQIGKSIADTYMGLSNILSELISIETLPIVIGGSQDLTHSIYLGISELYKNVNLTTVDSAIDLAQDDSSFDSKSYLQTILFGKRRNLFNYVNLGHQSYYCSFKTLKQLSKMKFDAYRLGTVRAKIEDTEPILRDTHILSLDISCVRRSDAPGYIDTVPNGFYGEELCQISRYAGISDNLKCFGLFEVNPEYDLKNQTSALAAQIIWYFIDGVSSRYNDYPKDDDKRYTKYVVNIGKTNENLIFYQNNNNKRWWIEVKNPVGNDKNMIISCKHSDYLLATRQEIPEIWLNTIQKLI